MIDRYNFFSRIEMSTGDMRETKFDGMGSTVEEPSVCAFVLEFAGSTKAPISKLEGDTVKLYRNCMDGMKTICSSVSSGSFVRILCCFVSR